MESLDAFAAAKLAVLDAAGLRRALRPTTRAQGAEVLREGRRLISFSSNDYLGLASHPVVVEAATAAARRFGAGAGASRLVCGDHPLMAELELALARLKGAEAALVFSSGYLANLGAVPALVGLGDLVVLDELSHSCMWAGARLSRARVEPFRHNDLDHARGVLGRRRGGAGRALLLTERVFSMDGDRAPETELLALAAAHDAWTLVDDAHGLGVVEPGDRAPLEMGTLSKSLGSQGGYLCASAPVIELMKNRARGFVYTTGLAPPSAAAALAALEVMAAEPDRRARPLGLARRFTRRLRLPEAASAIVPVTVGEARAALALSAALEARGFLVPAIRPPTVPVGTARLRLAFSALHTEAQVDALADALAELRPALLPEEPA